MDKSKTGIHDEVMLSPWREDWEQCFEAEKAQIEEAFTSSDISVEIIHIGSTSVRDMSAKPIIDILLCPATHPENCIPYLEQVGYKNLGECGRPGRYFLSKGNEPNQTFYVHLCSREHIVARDQLLFQKILRENGTVFDDYLALKEELAEMFLDNRLAYRRLKGLFVESVLSAYRYGMAQYAMTRIGFTSQRHYWRHRRVSQSQIPKHEMSRDETTETPGEEL